MPQRASRSELSLRSSKGLSQRRWIAIGVVLAGLFIFAAFLIASFPYNDTVSQLLAPYRLKLVYEEQRMSLPIGVKFERVSLYDEKQSPRRLIVQSPAVRLAPVISSLLFARPELKLDADLYGGSFRLRLRQMAPVVKADFEADSLSLAESQPLRQFGVALTGLASGNGTASLSNGDLMQDKGDMQLRGSDVTVEITSGFPKITLGSVSGHFEMANGVVAFNDVEVHGGDVEAHADGEIHLAPDLEESTIAVHLNLTPTQSGRDHFGILFNMLPHPPSEGPYEITGPLRSPRIS